MIFNILTLLLLSLLGGCIGKKGRPDLQLSLNESPHPTGNGNSKSAKYSVKEYILPSMEIHGTAHGGFDLIAQDDSILITGLIKVFDPNLGNYPQKIFLWNIKENGIQFNELKSGKYIFKINFSDTPGADYNFIRIIFNDNQSPYVGYIDNSGLFKIISSDEEILNSNTECDHIASAFDEDLMKYTFSCLKNISNGIIDLQLSIISSDGTTTFTRTFTDNASMNSAHTYLSKNGSPYVFTKNYANLNEEKNLSLLSNDGLQILARGQLNWGNLNLSINTDITNLCTVTSETTIKQYDVTQISQSLIAGVSSTATNTLPNCLVLNSEEILLYAEGSLIQNKGHILNKNSQKILDLGSYGFKSIYVVKKINNYIYIVGLDEKSNQAKVLILNKL